MAKTDRSILAANDQSKGQFGDPDKLEASISHLADTIDLNDTTITNRITENEKDIAYNEGRLTELLRNSQQASEVVDARMGFPLLRDALGAKANQSSLNITNNNLTSKVDKDGAGQVTYAMLAQDARQQITGGNTAVVGVNSVLEENIVDKVVSRKKLTEDAKIALPFQPNSTFAYDRGDGILESNFNFMKRIKDVKIYGAKLTDRFHFNRIFKPDANTIQIEIKRVDSPLWTDAFATVPIAEVNAKIAEINLGEYNSSGITAKVIIDFTDGVPEFDYSNPARLDYSVSGLAHSTIVEPLGYSLVLPSSIPCVVGHEMNIYHENILLGAMEKELDMVIYPTVSWASYNKRYKHFAPDSSAGSITLSAEIVDKGKTKKVKTASFHPVPASAGDGVTKKVMVIGDSKTDDPTKLLEVLNLFNNDVMNIELVGTKDIGTAPNEGRYGWGIDNYYNQQSYNTLTNAFYNPTTGLFDFAYYMNQNGFAGVDYVFIDLGANDAGKAWSTIKTGYDHLISSIHAYNPAIKVVLSLQEGHYLGENNNNDLYRQQKATLNNVVKNLINEYDDRTGENIFLCPQYLNFDLYNDFPMQELPISSRNPRTVLKATDITHPSAYGYYKIADMYYYMIKYLATIA